MFKVNWMEDYGGLMWMLERGHWSGMGFVWFDLEWWNEMLQGFLFQNCVGFARSVSVNMDQS